MVSTNRNSSYSCFCKSHIFPFTSQGVALIPRPFTLMPSVHLPISPPWVGTFLTLQPFKYTPVAVVSHATAENAAVLTYHIQDP